MGAVTDKRAGDDDDEAEHIAGCAEAVGLDAGEGAHFGDDGWDEEGKRGEADVAAKVLERRQVACTLVGGPDGIW